MQNKKNKTANVFSVLLGNSFSSPQIFFFDGSSEKNEEFNRDYIFPYSKKETEGEDAPRSSRDVESANYSFVNLRPLFEDAMRESGMPEGGEDARMFRDAYGAFDAMAVDLEKKMKRGFVVSKADLAEPLVRFASAINNIAKARNAGR